MRHGAVKARGTRRLVPRSQLPNVTSYGATPFVEPFVGPPWNVHGPSWSAMVGMVAHGRSWSGMVGVGILVVAHSRSWFIMVAHGQVLVRVCEGKKKKHEVSQTFR